MNINPTHAKGLTLMQTLGAYTGAKYLANHHVTLAEALWIFYSVKPKPTGLSLVNIIRRKYQWTRTERATARCRRM